MAAAETRKSTSQYVCYPMHAPLLLLHGISIVSGRFIDVPPESMWGEYVKRVAPGMTQSGIAGIARVDQTVVSRWLSGRSIPRVESVIQFARSAGRSPIEAMVAAGYITSEEAGMTPGLQISIRELATDELLAEIRRRVTDRER